MTLSTSGRNAMINGLTALLNSGTIEIATDNTFSTILATFSFGSTAFGTASTGTATANSIASTTASNSGNAEAFRMKNSSAAIIYDRSDTDAISASGGGGALILNQASTAIVSGQTVSISSLSFTQAAGV